MAQETKLLRSAKDGNTEAFEQIVKKYQSLVCAITFSGTGRVDISEELAQETFLSAWKNLSQLKKLSGFRSWLCAIARNSLNNYYRRKKTQPLDLTAAENVSDQTQDPSENLISREEHVMLEQAICRIPVDYREPLVMYYRQEKSVKEVAAGLGLKESTVRMRLHRARKMLRDEMASRLEQTLERTGPGKAFTTAVMVAVAAAAVGGSATASVASAVSANTAGSGGISRTISTCMSTVTAKIVTAAAVVAVIGVAAVYSTTAGDQTSESVSEQQRRSAESVQSAELSAGPVSEPKASKAVSKDSDASVSPPQPAAAADDQQTSLSAQPSQATEATDLTTENPDSLTGITGIIFDKTQSKVIGDAEVFMRSPGGRVSVRTDSCGRFSLTMDLKGDQRVPHEFEHRFTVVAEGCTTRRVSIHLRKGEMTDAGTVELTPGTKVAGVVYDQNNQPLKGAKVATFHFTNHPVITDKEGKFEIDGLDPAWSSYTLQATHADYPPATVRFSPLKAGETTYKDLVMTRGMTVYGCVTDSEGRPVANVTVGNTTSRCMWNVIEDKTDADGNYTLKNVPPGEFVLWAIDNGYAPYVDSLILRDDVDKKQIDIRLSDPRLLHGKVVDAMGNPVSDVLVSIREYKGVSNLSNHRVRTDAKGLFTIPNAPPEGKLILEIFSEQIPNVFPELEMGQELYTITVDRAGRVYGKVIAKASQEPVKTFVVRMNFSKAGESKRGFAATWSRQGHTFTSSEGCFDTATENIPIGSAYALTVEAEGFEPLTIDPVFVQPASETPERTEFALCPSRIINGTVSDCNDVGIPEARVRWISGQTDDEHWDDRDTAVTDKNGQFSIAGIGNDADVVYVSAALFAPVVFSVDDLPCHAKGDLAFKLDRAPYLYGSVTDHDGKPIVGAAVAVQPHYQVQKNWRLPRFQTTTDMNGDYELFDLPTGTASLTVSWPNNRNSVLDHRCVIFQAGQEVELNFSPVRFMTVSGMIPDAVEETEKVAITPYLYHPGSTESNWEYDRNSDATIHPDGSFTCQGLKEGKYFLHLHLDSWGGDGYHATTDVFEVDADHSIEGLTFNVSTAAIEIRAVDRQTGNPLGNVRCSLESEFGYLIVSKSPADPNTLDSPFQTLFGSVPAGRFKAVAMTKGYAYTESKYVELSGGEAKSITLELSPCAVVNFILPQDVWEGIDSAYLKCKVTDNATGQTVPSPFNPKIHQHTAAFRKNGDRPGQAWLNLPEGSYTMEYSLSTWKIGESKVRPTGLTGSLSVELETGEITTVQIPFPKTG